MARLYIDEDPHQDLAISLRELGQDVISTDEVAHKGLSDAKQLLFATQQNRVIVTCNTKHFALLHEALVLWWRRVAVSEDAAHAGILIIPSGSLIGLAQSTRIINEFLQRPEVDALAGRLFRWTPSGWNEVKIE